MMQYRKRITTLRLAALLLFLLPLTGPVVPVQGQQIPFENFNIKNGLPQNTVNDIEQDARGYLWFATQVGAARYDGYDFEYFTVANGLPDNFINCMLLARDGKMWFGTEGGLASFDGKVFRAYDEDCGLVDNRIDLMEEDLQGNIWASTAYGISIVTPDSIVNYTKDNGLQDNVVKKFFVDSQGRMHVSTYPDFGYSLFEKLGSFTTERTEYVISDIVESAEGEIWFATQGDGIFVEKEGKRRQLGPDAGLLDLDVLSLDIDHRGRIWCTTFLEGIFVYENGRFHRPFSSGRNAPLVVDIFEDSKQRLWFLDYESGIWLYDELGFRNITEANGLASDLVLDVLEDSFGNIWLGTFSGASKYGKAIFEIYNDQHGLSENDEDVLSTFMDSRDRLWIGTYEHLYFRRNGKIIMLDNVHHGFEAGNSPYCFAEDHRGHIYVGQEHGLSRFNGRNLVPVEVPLFEAEQPGFFDLLYASDRWLWCATTQGVIRMKDGQIRYPDVPEGLENLQARAFDQRGEDVFVAGESGVYRYSLEGKLLNHFSSRDSLPSNICNDLCHDAAGNVWVATDLGLARISADGTNVSKYGSSRGLSSTAVYFLHMSGDELWMGTERGLYRYYTLSGESRYYGVAEGFYPLETHQGSVTRGKGREIWMGTVEGLVRYVPNYDSRDTIAPILIMHDPSVGGESFPLSGLSEGEIPVFPFKRNSIVFRFTGIQTTLPQQNRFSFYLENFDEDWSEPGLQRWASYKKLPSGSYTFRVKVSNSEGVVNPEEASFSFSIKTPFWRTGWFIIIYMLAGLFLVYGIIKYRERQLIREKRMLESKVRERTREIEDQKVEIEAQRDEIFEKNKEITDSIHYAKHIQNAVLPGKMMLERILPEHFILFKPRDIVSGDFYWVEQKNDRLVICAADCTGHGVPGAFMSLLGLTFLSEIVNKDGVLKASEILNRLRDSIVKSMSHKDLQARDGMDLSLIVIDRQINILEYAGAYNPLMIVRDGEAIEYKADKMPVGKHEGDKKSFTNHKIILQEGDVIYMFTDGFPDQFGGPKGGKYKARPFKRFLLQHSGKAMSEQSGLLAGELENWMGEEEQVDDILVMGIRYQSK